MNRRTYVHALALVWLVFWMLLVPLLESKASHDPLKERQLSLCIAKVSIRTHIHGLRPKVGADAEKKKELERLEEHYQWLEKACPDEVEQRFGSAALSR